MKEQMLITRAAKIAQPSDVTVRPAEVKPSMVKVVGLSCWLIQATKSNKAPFMTNEINPKVRMYSGMAITLMTGAIIELIRPKIAPITNKVMTSCQISLPPYGCNWTPGMIAETNQRPNPLMTVETRKRFMVRLCHY